MHKILKFSSILFAIIHGHSHLAQIPFTFNIILQGTNNCGYTITGNYSAMNDSTNSGTFTAIADPAGNYSVTLNLSENSAFITACAYPIDPNCGPSGCASDIITVNNGVVPYLNIVLGSNSDMDNDGFTAENGDCDDNNAYTNPYAPEICGDSIDNNCNGSIDENCINTCSPNIQLVTDSMYPGIPSYTIYIINLEPSGTAPFSYLWNLGDGTFSNEPYPTNTYPSTGTFTVCLTVISSDSCSAESCITFTVDSMGNVSGGGYPMSPVFLNIIPSIDALSIGDFSENQTDVSIYPNPASSLMRVSYHTELAVKTLEVVDMNGKVLIQRQVSSEQGSETFSVEHLSAGLYHIVLSGPQGTLSRSRVLISR